MNVPAGCDNATFPTGPQLRSAELNEALIAITRAQFSKHERADAAVTRLIQAINEIYLLTGGINGSYEAHMELCSGLSKTMWVVRRMK